MSERTYTTVELENSRCVEIFCTSGPRDGELLGYAIFFSGGWDGWAVEPCSRSLMKRIAVNVATKEEAIRKITE